jgi:hypothetical protein
MNSGLFVATGSFLVIVHATCPELVEGMRDSRFDPLDWKLIAHVLQNTLSECYSLLPLTPRVWFCRC